MPNLCLVECKTMQREICLFPFYWNGEQHYECIKGNMGDGTPWCIISASGEKDFCKSDCPGNLVLVCSYNHAQYFFQLRFVRPLVSSPSPTMVHSMISVSHMTMVAHHGVILVMVKSTSVHLPVQVTLC